MRLRFQQFQLSSLIVVCCCVATGRGSAEVAELVDCLSPHQQRQLSSYADFVAGRPTRPQLHAAWWSSKKSRINLSIVTGLTVSRLDQLQAQCSAWRGSLVAAVYLVLEPGPGPMRTEPSGMPEVKEAVALMSTLHAELERSNSSCSLDMLLLVEMVSDSTMRWMLPINVLRNYGLLAARTRLVAMVDVDLLPSAGLANWLAAPGNLDWLKQECSQKKVFVLPAFETAPRRSMAAAHRIAEVAAQHDKRDLLKLVEARLVWQFALHLFKEGHNCTDYPRWFASSSSYPIGWTKDYEPWFIADRLLMPFYDSVFRGYGWNKVTQVTNVRHQGFEFHVHPTGFLVHRQHKHSKAGSLYQASKAEYEREVKQDKKKGEADTSLAATTHKFRNRVLEQLAAGVYQPVLDEGVAHCVSKLSWWQRDSAAAPGAPPQLQPLLRRQRWRRRQRRRRGRLHRRVLREPVLREPWPPR